MFGVQWVWPPLCHNSVIRLRFAGTVWVVLMSPRFAKKQGASPADVPAMRSIAYEELPASGSWMLLPWIVTFRELLPWPAVAAIAEASTPEIFFPETLTTDVPLAPNEAMVMPLQPPPHSALVIVLFVTVPLTVPLIPLALPAVMAFEPKACVVTAVKPVTVYVNE